MRLPLVWVVAGVLGWLAAAQAEGQTLLRWKLKPGERLAVVMTQETESKVGFSGKLATTTVELKMRLAWDVVSVNENAITVKQTIEHVGAKLVSGGGNAEFDSAAKTRATGLAKRLAESLQPLVGAEVEVVFTPRGEVTSAKATNEAAQKLFEAEDPPGDVAGAPRKSLVQLVSQSIAQLPEGQVAVGDKWTASRTIESAAGGMVHVTTYVLEAIEKGECRIATTGQLKTDKGGGKPGEMQIKKHTHTGKVQFLADEGRPVEVTQQQELETERVYRDTTIGVTLSSKLKMTFAADNK